MIKTEEPEAEDEYLKVIFTSAVSFSFSEVSFTDRSIGIPRSLYAT